MGVDPDWMSVKIWFRDGTEEMYHRVTNARVRDDIYELRFEDGSVRRIPRTSIRGSLDGLRDLNEEVLDGS
jgi:hypothetical protein